MADQGLPVGVATFLLKTRGVTRRILEAENRSPLRAHLSSSGCTKPREWPVATGETICEIANCKSRVQRRAVKTLGPGVGAADLWVFFLLLEILSGAIAVRCD